MKLLVWIFKKSEYLSALSIRLVYLTGKAKVPIHPKHLIRIESDLWYKKFLNKKTTVLDAGCGSGQHSLMIAPFVKKVVGLDYDFKNLEIARLNAIQKRIKNVEFKYTNLEEKINIKSNSFDLIVLFDILEHLISRQIFLKEIKRLLKRDGKILVVIPNLDTSWKRIQRKYKIQSFSDPDHKIEYTKESIVKELTKAGFVVNNISLVSYDTPWVGFIDLIGGISLTLYRKLAMWKQKMLKLHPENCSGFCVVAAK